MANDKFSIQEAVTYGWQTFKSHALFFMGMILAMAVIMGTFNFIAAKIISPTSSAFILVRLVLQVIAMVLGMITTRLTLDIYDTGEPDFAKISDIVPQILFYVIGKILYLLIVLVGLALLIVPGIIVAYMFNYVGYLIIDRGLGPIEALQESRAITDGYKMDIFLFSLVTLAVNVVGMIIPPILGLLVSIPVTMMASVYVYRRLAAAESA